MGVLLIPALTATNPGLNPQDAVFFGIT
jgi:hypothetical protein